MSTHKPTIITTTTTTTTTTTIIIIIIIIIIMDGVWSDRCSDLSEQSTD